jgi:hypothetical protein
MTRCSRTFVIAFVLASGVLMHGPIAHAQHPSGGLTVIALGDAGESNGVMRGNAFYITEMTMGRHDAGRPDMLLFLGDNFIPVGLNCAKNDVEGEVKSRLGPFKEVFEVLSRAQVHAIPGEHDYYARYAVETTALFGLFRVTEGPMGISDRGTQRESEVPSWTFHHGLPEELTVPITAGTPDSIQFIFFDSALLLRTNPATWHPALQRLQGILQKSKERAGIAWRVFCVHHPLHSVGVHGGYSVWDDEMQSVVYLTDCDRDTNAAGFLRNWLDPEDLCAERYRQYVDSVTAVIREVAVKIQLVLAAHDRSLQLLYYPESDPPCDACPKVHLVSGATSLPTRVKLSSPPREFTSASSDYQSEGMSPPGFAQLRFEQQRVMIVFYNGRNGDPVDMGKGQTTFWVDRSGALVEMPTVK